jgi:hypothetical protein
VPTTLVGAGKYKKFLYDTTPRTKGIQLKVEASQPIDIYIVQKSDLEAWRSSEDYRGSGFKSRKLLDAQMNIPKDFDTDWYLILDNTGSVRDVAVHYELFDV